MKILLIGGTGIISTAVTDLLLKSGEHEVYHLNRGSSPVPNGVTSITCDIKNETKAAAALKDLEFDVVADFISYTLEDVSRNYEIFKGKTKQYIFISSASAYQKPPASTIIKETALLDNPFWQYSKNKQMCEEYLLELNANGALPVTIVRPSHTYGDKYVPVAVHGKNGDYAVLKRMIEGKQIVVHGDGESLWVLTHNSDFAKGFVGLMGNEKALGEVFHITSNEALTWNQIHTIIAEKLGVEYKPFYVASSTLARIGGQYDFFGSLLGDKAYSVVFDNSKIKRFVPEFEATTKFKDGVSKTIDNVLANKELQKEDRAFNVWCNKVIDKLGSIEL